jgi:hypothetical protein
MGGNTMTMRYTGVLSGENIKFKARRTDGQGTAQEFIAKRGIL